MSILTAFFAFALVATATFSDLKASTDAQEVFDRKCNAVIEEFGHRPIAYTFKNWQGLTASTSPVVSLSKRECTANGNRIVVIAQLDAVQSISMTISGSVPSGSSAMSFISGNGSSPDYGSCTNESPRIYIQKAKEQGYVLTPQSETAIYANYREVACPAFHAAIIAELGAAAERVAASFDN